MSFQGSFPRTFSNASIRSHAPSAAGVYGISNGREWILIAAAENMQRELLEHSLEENTPLKKHRPTGFSYEVCDISACHGRVDALVKQYEPVCNRTLASR